MPRPLRSASTESRSTTFSLAKHVRSRRIPIPALERISIALILNRDVGITIARGLEVAEKILGGASQHLQLGPLATLAFDVAKLRAALERSIEDALESVAEPTRGRPRS